MHFEVSMCITKLAVLSNNNYNSFFTCVFLVLQRARLSRKNAYTSECFLLHLKYFICIRVRKQVFVFNKACGKTKASTYRAPEVPIRDT
jgi:hypothetical protein